MVELWLARARVRPFACYSDAPSGPEPQEPYGQPGRAGVLTLGLPHLVVEGLLPLAAGVQQQELERPLLLSRERAPSRRSQHQATSPSAFSTCTKAAVPKAPAPPGAYRLAG